MGVLVRPSPSQDIWRGTQRQGKLLATFLMLGGERFSERVIAHGRRENEPVVLLVDLHEGGSHCLGGGGVRDAKGFFRDGDVCMGDEEVHFLDPQR